MCNRNRQTDRQTGKGKRGQRRQAYIGEREKKQPKRNTSDRQPYRPPYGQTKYKGDILSSVCGDKRNRKGDLINLPSALWLKSMISN